MTEASGPTRPTMMIVWHPRRRFWVLLWPTTRTWLWLGCFPRGLREGVRFVHQWDTDIHALIRVPSLVPSAKRESPLLAIFPLDVPAIDGSPPPDSATRPALVRLVSRSAGHSIRMAGSSPCHCSVLPDQNLGPQLSGRYEESSPPFATCLLLTDSVSPLHRCVRRAAKRCRHVPLLPVTQSWTSTRRSESRALLTPHPLPEGTGIAC